MKVFRSEEATQSIESLLEYLRIVYDDVACNHFLLQPAGVEELRLKSAA